MPNESLIKQVDIILDILRERTTSIDNERLLNAAKKDDDTIQGWILDRSIEKLIRDNYIYMLPNGGYSITVEGTLFIGYEKQIILDNEKVVRISQMASDQKSYKDRLLWATWCAGIAAVLLLLWQVFLYLYPVHKDYAFWFWE